MRWRLFLIASLSAAIVGAGACLGLAYLLGVDAARPRLAAPGLLALAVLLAPLLTTFFASFFVYRHTARRRALQAMATALLSIILTLAFLYAGLVLFFARPTITEPRPLPTQLTKGE